MKQSQCKRILFSGCPSRHRVSLRSHTTLASSSQLRVVWKRVTLMSPFNDHARSQICGTAIDPARIRLVTVKELIAGCEAAALLQHALEEHAGWHAALADMPGAAREALERKIAASLSLMTSLPEQPSTSQMVVIPWQWFAVSDGWGGFSRSVGAVLFDPDRLFAAKDIVAMVGTYRLSALELACASHLLGDVDTLEALALSGALVSIDELTSQPWPVILGLRAWLPDDLTATEKHAVAAHIFWTMTYSGLGDAERIMNEEGASPSGSSQECWMRSDPAYREKLEGIACALNYDGWVDSLAALEALAGALCTPSL